MNSIFRPFRLPELAFCALGAIAVFGLINASNLVPDPLMKYWSMGAAVFFGVIGGWLLASDQNPSSKLNNLEPIKRRLGLTVGTLFFGVLGYFAVLLGLPTIFSKIALTPSAAQSSVAYIFKERGGRGCNYRVQLRGEALKESMNPCVSQELWKTLRVGDLVLVSYTQSSMGFFMEDIQKLP